MVETLTPAALETTVPRRVWLTASPRAGMRLSRCVTSLRTNTRPALTGAGLTAARTCCPVCSPRPANNAAAPRVCWKNADAAKAETLSESGAYKRTATAKP